MPPADDEKADVAKLVQEAAGLVAKKNLPAALRDKILAVKGRRPLRVIVHILKHGGVSTKELQSVYGYDQPPRAAQDVKDLGIKLKTKRGRTADDHSMVIYEFNLDAPVDLHKSGRRAFSKTEKAALVADPDNPSCDLCGLALSVAELQADHRVPFDIGGELAESERTRKHLMMLCPSCNRSKSWACEHCPNWVAKARNPDVCRSCYWSGNEAHDHSATVLGRWLTLSWQGTEVPDHDEVQEEAQQRGLTMGDAVKQLVLTEARRLVRKKP